MKINDWKEFGTFSNKASIPEPPKGTEQKIREEWGVFVAYRRPVDKDAWEYDGFFCYRANYKKAGTQEGEEWLYVFDGGFWYCYDVTEGRGWMPVEQAAMLER